MLLTVKAPWTPDQVASLNGYQACDTFHPFTCGSGHRTDGEHKDGEGVLLATPDGWVCPYCGYTQNWCHGFMADWSWRATAACFSRGAK